MPPSDANAWSSAALTGEPYVLQETIATRADAAVSPAQTPIRLIASAAGAPAASPSVRPRKLRRDHPLLFPNVIMASLSLNKPASQAGSPPRRVAYSEDMTAASQLTKSVIPPTDI
jgi:hypothetical protein